MPSAKKTSIVLFSGGLDSLLAATWAAKSRRSLVLLEIDHPGRPAGERRACRRIATRFPGARRMVVSLPFDPRIPRRAPGYIATRNLLYHALAQSVAETFSAAEVVAGHVPGDARSFADARQAYFRQIETLAAAGRPDRRRIPIINPVQGRIRELGREAPAPVAWTWSCWKDLPDACGTCEKCVRRARWLERISRSAQTSRARTPKAGRSPRG